MRLQNIRTIVWDLDGTLIDSFELFQEILTDALKGFDLILPSRETMLHNFHGSLEETIANVLDIEGDVLMAVIDAFLEVQAPHYKQVEHLVHGDASSLAKRAHARGIGQIIVTNREHEGRGEASPISITKRSSFKDYIKTVVSGDNSPYRKPDARALEKLTMESGILVIGDQFVDAEFARNLGGQAILVNRHTEDIAHLERLGADWQSFVTVVKSLDEVDFS